LTVYALRAADTFGADKEHPAVFTITEEIPAGKEPELEVKSGQAAKILTVRLFPRVRIQPLSMRN
jgi:molybdopterin biosynthesis enzyme